MFRFGVKSQKINKPLPADNNCSGYGVAETAKLATGRGYLSDR